MIRLGNRGKDVLQEKADFSIDVRKKEHPLAYIDKNYFWVILRNSNGCSSVYTCGWASTSEEAWKDANDAYERIVKRKNKGVQRWSGF